MDNLNRKDIEFFSGSSSDLGRGYGNGNPKISFKIKGIQKRAKALYRGDCMWGRRLQDKVTQFLQSDEVKDFIIDLIEKDELYEETYEKIVAEYKKKLGEVYNEGNPWPNFEDWYGNDERKAEVEDYRKRRNAIEEMIMMEVAGVKDYYELREKLSNEIYKK